MPSVKRRAIVLILLGLVLCALQTGVWSRSIRHDHSQTDVQDSESQNPPTEMPGVAGLFLLFAAGAIVVMAAPPYSE
jgi:ABC-type Fe3+ transport system permease subunit